jgi:hypothetical protein
MVEPLGLLPHYPPIKTSATASSTSKEIPPFAKGQIWQIGEVNLTITTVGKVLVHYKRFKKMRPGTPTTMSSIRVHQYLVNNKAILLQADLNDSRCQQDEGPDHWKRSAFGDTTGNLRRSSSIGKSLFGSLLATPLMDRGGHCPRDVSK